MSSIFWKFATHAAEVEVDLETGIVKVLRVVAAHDVGKAINPMGCEQQVEGAVIMGLSNTLYEEFKMENGRILNDTLADYKLATMQELPKIVTILVESVQKEGPSAQKGSVNPPPPRPPRQLPMPYIMPSVSASRSCRLRPTRFYRLYGIRRPHKNVRI